ncbi:MAG: hypothetical protein J7I99_05115, partial [Methanophagales archaeon]|nr:hypothetical protein [Methanophagales archaeon]
MANTQGDGLFCWQLIPEQNMQQFMSNSLPTYIIVGTQPHCWWSILRLLQLLSWLLLNDYKGFDWVFATNNGSTPIMVVTQLRHPRHPDPEISVNSYHGCYSTGDFCPNPD